MRVFLNEIKWKEGYNSCFQPLLKIKGDFPKSPCMQLVHVKRINSLIQRSVPDWFRVRREMVAPVAVTQPEYKYIIISHQYINIINIQSAWMCAVWIPSRYFIVGCRCRSPFVTTLDLLFIACRGFTVTVRGRAKRWHDDIIITRTANKPTFYARGKNFTTDVTVATIFEFCPGFFGIYNNSKLS